MGTEDEIAGHKTTDVSLTPPKSLSRFDTLALRRDFERLSVDDLTALASFPVEPHALIGRVVAVTHCLLLSLAPEHSTLELCPPPWALLRLQFLDNTPGIWRKLRKRARQLENGVRSLSTAQIRFGCKELVPYILPSKKQTQHQRGSWQLNQLAQVSTIAASLGAWAVFCLCCSVLPASLMNIRLREIHSAAPSCHNDILAAQRLPIPGRSPNKEKSGKHSTVSSASKNASSVKNEAIPTSNCYQRSSKRVGTKIGGRFLLVHARFTSCSNPCRTATRVAADPLGEWSVYCLDANRVGRKQQHEASVNASWWNSFHSIELSSSVYGHSLTLSQMSPFAQQSLLLQLGFHEHIFERPSQDIPSIKSPRPCSPVFTLKFDVVGVNSQQLYLLSIGSVLITMETTLANLRDQLVSPIALSLASNLDSESSFRFLYRGAFMATSQERYLIAAMLLPFAVLVLVPEKCSVAEYRKNNRVSQLWCHHCDVVQSLVNAGVPDHLAHHASTSAPVQVFAMRQPLTTNCIAANEKSIASVIVEFFTHWRAFVHFQQLQDASTLFQLQQRSPKQKTKLEKTSPKRRLKNTSDSEDSVPYGPQPAPLPRKKFNCKKEWLLPLYATVNVVSPTRAVLRGPFQQDVERALAFPCRLVLADDEHVIHVTQVSLVSTERNAFGVDLIVLDIVFLRDESCSLESLVKLAGAYVWIVMARKPHIDRQYPALPPEWLCSLYRFVQHPTFDFQSPGDQQFQHFRVRVPWHLAERAVEAAFWSKTVDWKPVMAFTDLYTTVLRQIFDALCRSHPPGLAVDSVKFSKMLYEAKIQPTLLTIGDAAFLFASNIMYGSSYEMGFDGFVRAIEWLAQQFYCESNTTKTGKASPSKNLPGIQHAILKWQLSQHARERLLSPLRHFCFETLVHLPSLSGTWGEIMNSWRLASKRSFLEGFALRYCAATRLRASWIGFVTWKAYLQRRQRMKDERLAATKLQSVARGRRNYLEYSRVRRIITKTQLRIHARSELRRLRAERAAFVERMRLRMVKLMRYHLWVLHEWKKLNPDKAARRERIRQKRLRRLGVAVFPLDASLLRFTLYRATPVVPQEGMEVDVVDTQHNASCEEYELEVMDATQSWGQVFTTSQQQIDRFISQEFERVALQMKLGFAALSEPIVPHASSCLELLSPQQKKLQRDRNKSKATTKRDSVVFPASKPNVIILALARRLMIQKDVRQMQTTMVLRCYSNPIDTSLGKLIFKGALRSQYDHHERTPRQGQQLVERHIVRVLEWAGTFKLYLYTPSTSVRRRYDLSASFVHSVLCFARFGSMSLFPEADDSAAAADEDQDKLRSRNVEFVQPTCLQIHRILNGHHKILALQCIVSYVLLYGVRKPVYSMLPHVIAEQERQRNEYAAAEFGARIARELQLIVKVQSRLRQHLARKTRLKLALALYSKQFDRELGRFVYTRLYRSRARVAMGDRKPFSLFDQDLPLPADEWELVSELISDKSSDGKSCFFNPRRGIFSRYNDVIAAKAIQRWFRGKMWNGINDWKLRHIVHALRYHQGIRKPDNVTDPEQLEDLKRYTLQLHVLQHQYKAAFIMYEATLKLSPDDLQTLVGLAILLVISCRYPPKQSWMRAMELLKRARALIVDELATAMNDVEQNGFRWALFLQQKDPHTIANYAAYSQCVHLDIDKAELLYRRALALDPTNELFVTNFQRLRSERAPGGLYAFAGPGKIVLQRSLEVRRGGADSQWREMEDPTAQPPMPKRFFQSLRTCKCTWELPDEEQSIEAAPER